MLSGCKILVTGGSGLVGRPIAEALAHDNEVWCLARFNGHGRTYEQGGAEQARAVRRDLESLGAVTLPWDMATCDLSELPDDFTHVVHTAAATRERNHDRALTINAEAVGLLMEHCAKALAFLHVSTFAVYRRQTPDHRHRESDPLGGVSTYADAYSVSKLAGEGVARAAARMLDLPVTIARLNVAYASTGRGGMPITYLRAILDGDPVAVPSGGTENYCSPIDVRDLVAQVEPMLRVARVPAVTVNWAGDEVVTQREFCRYLADLAGAEVHFEESDETLDSFASDNERRQALIGSCSISWRGGMQDALASHFPELVTQRGRT